MANFYKFINQDHPIADVYRHRDSNDNAIETIVDNKHETYFSDFPTVDSDDNPITAKTIKINIDTVGDGSGEEQEFTDIFVKCNNVEKYTINNIQVPDETNAPQPFEVGDFREPILTRTGWYQHHLARFAANLSNQVETLIQGQRTLKSITLEFTQRENTSDPIRIHEIFVLKHELYLDSNAFSDIQPVLTDRNSGVHTGLDGGKSRYESLGEREKISLEYEKPIIAGAVELELIKLIIPGTSVNTEVIQNVKPIHLVRDIQYFRHQYKRFVFEREYSRNTELTLAIEWSNTIDYTENKFMDAETGALVGSVESINPDFTLKEGLVPTEVSYGGFYYVVDFDVEMPTAQPLQPDVARPPLSPLRRLADNTLESTNGWRLINTPATHLTEVVTEFEDLVFVALFENEDTSIPFWSDYKENGFQISMNVCEA